MFRNPVQNQPLPKTSVANLLPDIFQSRALLTPAEAGAACGWAKQTVYNKLSCNQFPIPTVEFAGRTMVRTVDLLEFVERLRTTSSTLPAKSNKVGRPTKAEAICRRAEKSGGSK